MLLAYAAMKIAGFCRFANPAILASPHKVGFASTARDFICLLNTRLAAYEDQVGEGSAYKAADADPVWVDFSA